MQKLRVGLTVAFVLPDHEGFANAGAIRPALITRVWSPTCVNLTVLLDRGDARHVDCAGGVMQRSSAAYDEGGCAPGTWHRFLDEAEPANAELVKKWPSEPFQEPSFAVPSGADRSPPLERCEVTYREEPLPYGVEGGGRPSPPLPEDAGILAAMATPGGRPSACRCLEDPFFGGD